jgi:hypothetical protein
MNGVKVLSRLVNTASLHRSFGEVAYVPSAALVVVRRIMRVKGTVETLEGFLMASSRQGDYGVGELGVSKQSAGSGGHGDPFRIREE